MTMNVRSTIRNAMLAGVLLGVGACDEGGPPGPSSTGDTLEVNAKLADGARRLAVALNDQTLRTNLGAALAAKPTGDFEVLFRDAWELRLGDGRTLREALAGSTVAGVDLAHIAAPGGVPAWSNGEPVEVTWAPSGTDDAGVLELYDGRGQVRLVPADVRPEGAVVVVAINERVAPTAATSSGDVELAQGALTSNACNGWSCTTSNCRDVRLGRVKIYDDKEPWTKGDPEIYLYCSTPGARFDQIHYTCANKDLPGVNDEDTWYTYNSLLLPGVASGYPVQCWLMERDEGRTSPVDSDDKLGSATVYYGDGSRTYDVGDGVFTLY
jgi:hypothetical protein